MDLKAYRTRLALIGGVFVSLLYGFQTLLLEHSFMYFNDPKEDMSYAWYVPIFSLYVVWTERRRIAESLGAPSAWGLFATIPFLAIGFLGARGTQIRLEIISFAGLLVTVPWTFFGAATARRLAFPAAFLLFCLPLSTYLDIVTVRLRLFATSTAAALLQAFGSGVVRTGTALALPDGSFAVDVAAPCSGLRSIFALTALTAGYAYFNQPTWLRRAILFAFAIPLAVAGNVARLISIFFVGSIASPEFATGFYHDYSGYVVFLVSVFLMVAVGEAITRIGGRVEEAANAAPPAPSRGGLILPVVASLLIVPLMVFQAQTPPVTLCAPPEIELGEIEGFTSEAAGASESERSILPDDTKILKRTYRRADGRSYFVSVVIGGRSKSSIHRPELCLPAQGFLMMDPHDLEIGGRRWRVLKLAGDLEQAKAYFSYTFYNQAGYRTSSSLARIFRDVWDRSVFNRIDRWVMITVVSSHPDAVGFTEFLSRLKEVRR